MASEHQVLLDWAAMGDVLQRFLDAEAARVGEPSRRILLVIGPGRKSALAEAAHAVGLILADHGLLLRRDEDQGFVGSLHRFGEAGAIPFAGMLQVALGYPVILAAIEADIELEMMVSERILREGDLPFRSRFQRPQERIAHRR